MDDLRGNPHDEVLLRDVERVRFADAVVIREHDGEGAAVGVKLLGVVAPPRARSAGCDSQEPERDHGVRVLLALGDEDGLGPGCSEQVQIVERARGISRAPCPRVGRRVVALPCELLPLEAELSPERHAR